MEQSQDENQIALNRAHQVLQEILNSSYVNTSILQQQADISPLIVQQLIHYMLLNPNELLNQNFQPNVPYKFCEYLECSDDFLLSLFFDNQTQLNQYQMNISSQLLDNFFNVLNVDRINETTCGYFSRVLKSLIEKRGYSVWNYFENNKRIIFSLIKHLDQISIAETILSLILLNTQQPQDINYTNQIIQLIARLIKVMQNRPEEKDLVDNICWIFSDILYKKLNNYLLVTEDNQNQQEQIIKQINQPLTFFSIAQLSNSPQPYYLLSQLIQLNSKLQEGQDIQYEQICEQIPSLLECQGNIQQFTNTNLEINYVFGAKRLNLLELALKLIELKDEKIINILIKNRLLQNLQQIILQYPYNNVIQLMILKIITIVLEMSHVEEYQQIFEDLIKFVIKDYSCEMTYKGFKNFRTQIANTFLKTQQQELIKLLQANNSWVQYVDQNLSKINEIEQQFLFNYNPRDFSGNNNFQMIN